MMPKIGVFFDGGGCRGIVQIGQFHALLEYLEQHYELDLNNLVLGGVSIGAINAAHLAQAHTPDELRDYLKDLEAGWERFGRLGPEMIFDTSYRTIGFSSRNRDSIAEPDVLHNLADGKLFGTRPLNSKKVVTSPIEFHVLTSNSETQDQDRFTNRQERVCKKPSLIRNAVIASAGLPPYLAAENIGKIRHYDGARINLGNFCKIGCDVVFILLTQPRPKDIMPITNPLKHYRWTIEPLIYMSIVGNGMDKSELRRVKKEAEVLQLLNEAEELLVSQHRFAGKKDFVREQIGRIRKRMVGSKDNRHVAYPIPIYTPKLSRTLQVTSFAKDVVATKDVLDDSGAHTQKKGELLAEGDFPQAKRASYVHTKNFLQSVDLDSPEAIPIF